MKRLIFKHGLGVSFLLPVFASAALGQAVHPIVFTTFIESEQELPRQLVMVQSLRTFGGRYKDAPVWVYLRSEMMASRTDILEKISSLDAELRAVSKPPEEATWFFLAGKIFAAAEAEAAAQGKAAVLARLDPDTVIVQEPDELILPQGKTLGYRPVFHRNINPLYREPLDAYWSRAYEVMGVREAAVFPMVTPADGDTIRPYFQAGCLVVRPERGILRQWVESFARLYKDPLIKELCEKDQRQRLFTFQVALTGAILGALDRSEMMQYSDRINYPIFFKEMFGAKRDFHDITDAVTIRYEHFFENPPPDWDTELKGPADRIAWLKEHFEKGR